MKRPTPPPGLDTIPKRLGWYIDNVLKGRSQRSVAGAAAKYGLGSPTGMGNWISGRYPNPRVNSIVAVMRTLREMADADGVGMLNIEWLLFEEGDATVTSPGSRAIPRAFQEALAELPKPSAPLLSAAYALARDTHVSLTRVQWTRVLTLLSHGEAMAMDYINVDAPTTNERALATTPVLRQLAAANPPEGAARSEEKHGEHLSRSSKLEPMETQTGAEKSSRKSGHIRTRRR
jgi:hypothetical protein